MLKIRAFKKYRHSTINILEKPKQLSARYFVCCAIKSSSQTSHQTNKRSSYIQKISSFSMSQYGLLDKVRTFFGLEPRPPKNDFRNPIWSSDDEDDGDELYSRRPIVDSFEDTVQMHQEFIDQMHEIIKSFGNMFGDVRSLNDDLDPFTSINSMLPEGDKHENYNADNLRDYYLKPGYHSRKPDEPRDVDLDGKISSNDISGLLKQDKNVKDSDAQTPGGMIPFTGGNTFPGRSFCQTIITTSVTKPDGTVETRRIIKNGNEVVEQTTTTLPDSQGPQTPYNNLSNPSLIYNQVLSEFGSLFRNFY